MKARYVLTTAAILVAMMFVLNGCDGGDGSDDSKYDFKEVVIDHQGGDFNLANGIKLSIPPGAVSEATTFQLRVVRETEIVLPDNIFRKYEKHFSAGFEAMPYGYKFDKPISVSLPGTGLIDSTSLPYPLSLNTVTNALLPTGESDTVPEYEPLPEGYFSIIKKIKIHCNDDGNGYSIEYPELSEFPEEMKANVVLSIERLRREMDCEGSDSCRCCNFMVESDDFDSESDSESGDDKCYAFYSTGSIQYLDCPEKPKETWNLNESNLDVKVIPDNEKIKVGEIIYFTIKLTDESGQPVTDFSIKELNIKDTSVITEVNKGDDFVGIKGLSLGTSTAETLIEAGKCQYKGWLTVEVVESKIELSHDLVTIPEGESINIGVKLSDPPPVTQSILVLVLVSGDKDISVQSGETMIFNHSNWDTYRYFQLAAAEDKDSLNGTAYILVMSEADYYASEDITAKEEDNDNELRLAIEAKASKFNVSNQGDELHDEFNGEVPLTIDCGSGGLGTVKGTAILDYDGSGYSPGGEDYGPCIYDIVGVAHIFVDGDVNCSEDFSLDLNLKVITDYIFTATCEDFTESTPNTEEYDGRFTLNSQNDYVYELEETWQEGNEYGTAYLRVELLPY